MSAVPVAVEPLTDVEARLRRDHFRGALSDRCWECEQEWPCEVAGLLATVDQLRVVRDAASALFAWDNEPYHEPDAPILIYRRYQALETALAATTPVSDDTEGAG